MTSKYIYYLFYNILNYLAMISFDILNFLTLKILYHGYMLIELLNCFIKLMLGISNGIYILKKKNTCT